MNSYTITIAPNDGSANTTTLVVDTSGDEVRITDVHLHDRAGLTGGRVPTVDFALLLRAFTPPTTPAAIEATPTGNTIETTPEPPSVVEEQPPVPAEPASPERSSPARRTRRRAAKPAEASTPEATAPDTASAPTPRTRGRRTSTKTTGAATRATTPAAAKATTASSAKKASPKRRTNQASTERASTERAYRRMPDDFAVVYEHNSSPTVMADHYGVPRHTVNGWIRRHNRTISVAATQR